MSTAVEIEIAIPALGLPRRSKESITIIKIKYKMYYNISDIT